MNRILKLARLIKIESEELNKTKSLEGIIALSVEIIKDATELADLIEKANKALTNKKAA